ncbi:CHAT domain-containing protein [Streptomyces sp. NPDC019890]|uniref:CHAT domain-containing protein n=1 Tax=Streptomyces sp. NPDC019890 TaxID=3365064 RepID=UPI0038500AA2
MTATESWRLLAAVDLSTSGGPGDALRLVERLYSEDSDEPEPEDRTARDDGLRVAQVLLGRGLPADDRALVSDFCSSALLERFLDRGTLADLDEALSIRRAETDFTDSEWGCAARVNLASLLMTSWDWTRREEHLVDARTALASAAGLATTADERAVIAGGLGNVHARLYDLRRDVADLQKSIDEYTVAAASPDPSVAAQGNASLAAAYLDRFRTAGGDGEDLAEAERLARAALAGSSAPSASWRHELLVRILRERCALDRDDRRLTEAWELITALLDGAGQDSPARASFVGTAASVAHLRYLARHDRAVLNEAIDLTEEALGVLDDVSTPDPQDRAVLANEACLLLTERFTLDGARRDIDRAVEVAQRSLDDPLPQNIALGIRTNLANALYRRYESYEAVRDLDRGIALTRVVTSRASDAPEKADALNSLALLLGEKGRRTGRDADFREALGRLDEAIAVTSAGSVDRAASLINKATLISDRADAGAARPADGGATRDALIALLDEAWRQAPETSAVRARAAYLLGCRHAERAGLHAVLASSDAAERSQSLTATEADDLRRAFELWREAVGLDEPFVTIEAGQQLGNASFALREWEAAALSYRVALGAADELTTRRSLAVDRQLARFQVQGVAAAAALAELRAGSVREAVLRLEEGTATLLARALGQRARQVPYEAVAEAARILDGPLVYWAATSAGGFAIVVRPDGGIVERPLAVTSAEVESRLAALRVAFTAHRGTTRSVLADWEAAVRHLLAWTWDAVVAPVTEDLDGFATVGLIPIGRLASLPLAAAAAPSGASLLFRTLPRLLPGSRAVRPQAPWPTAPGIVVGCDPGEGTRRLPHAEAEAALVADCYTRVGRLSVPCPGEPAPIGTGGRVLRARGTATRTPEAASGAQRWIGAFGGAEVAHVICHYDLDPDQPLDSVLRFGDGVRVADLLERRLPGAPHFVLSACDTGLGGVRLPDEALGLGSALLAAGARSVVASLWPLDDELAAAFMGAYHHRLAAGEDPAQALVAVQREAAGDQPAVVWPGLVHMG